MGHTWEGEMVTHLTGKESNVYHTEFYKAELLKV